MEKIRNFFKDESGASAVEYGLLVAVVAVVLLAGVQTFYTSLVGIYQDNANKIANIQ